MGIKICPDCGGKVSESRSDCPHCGYLFKTRCPDCGKEVDPSITECPDCGYLFNPKQIDKPAQTANVKVIVKRSSAFVGCAIASVISVDGAQVASVSSGGECSFYVTPGMHCFSIGKGQNGPITANISDAARQINVKPEGVLTICFVVRTKMLLGYYNEITYIEQK